MHIDKNSYNNTPRDHAALIFDYACCINNKVIPRLSAKASGYSIFQPNQRFG